MSAPVSRFFRRIGWGLLFELIDFRLVFFDVLPDFIGYILIASGLHGLGMLHANYRRARWIAIAMIVLTLPHVMMQSTFSMSSISALPLGLHLYGQLLHVLHVAMGYFVLTALHDMALQANDRMMREKVGFRMGFFLLVNVSQLILYPFILNMNDDWAMVLVVLGLLGVIAELLFLRLPFIAAKQAPRSYL